MTLSARSGSLAVRKGGAAVTIIGADRHEHQAAGAGAPVSAASSPAASWPRTRLA
jgi:hypothetical protein